MAPETADKFLKALGKWREASRELAAFVIFAGFFYIALKNSMNISKKYILGGIK